MLHKSIKLTLIALVAFTLLIPFPLMKSFAVGTSANQASVLTIDAGNGIRAEISNYSLDGQQFCFTITNLSPIPIIAIGLANADIPGRTIFVSGFTHTGAGNFFLGVSEFNGRGVDVSVEAQGLSATLANGLAPGLSASFCLFANYAEREFTIDELFSRFLILFSDGLPANGFFLGAKGAECGDEYARLTISDLNAGRVCFKVRSDSDAKAITGFGFDLPGERGPFALISVNPLVQPGSQNLVFSASPGRVPGIKQNVTFAMLTREKFAGGSAYDGVPSGSESSSFCVAGNFSGLDPIEIMHTAIIRLQGDVAVWASVEGCSEHGSALTGIVAGNPR